MRMHIDISGQIIQRNHPSVMAFVKDDGTKKSVYLDPDVKRKLLSKYSGQVVNLVEKLHCIMIYYCIKGGLQGADELVICEDENPRKIKYLLPFLFKETNLPTITFRKHDDGKSKAHWTALKTYRKRRKADLIVKREMIMDKLFSFKEKEEE